MSTGYEANGEPVQVHHYYITFQSSGALLSTIVGFKESNHSPQVSCSTMAGFKPHIGLKPALNQPNCSSCRMPDLNLRSTTHLCDSNWQGTLVGTIAYNAGLLCHHRVWVILVFVRDLTSKAYLNSPNYYKLQ